jgi:hypothetical protein
VGDKVQIVPFTFPVLDHEPALLARAMELSEELTHGGFIDALDSGRYELWRDAKLQLIVCTETGKNAPVPFLHLVFVVGSERKLPLDQIVDWLEDLGRSRGVKKLTAIAVRKGWNKVAPKLGFTPVAVEFEKRID